MKELKITFRPVQGRPSDDQECLVPEHSQKVFVQFLGNNHNAVQAAASETKRQYKPKLHEARYLTFEHHTSSPTLDNQQHSAFKLGATPERYKGLAMVEIDANQLLMDDAQSDGMG